MPRTEPTLITKVAARLALTSYVPSADYDRFEKEGIRVIHEGVKLRLRQRGPGLNRLRMNRACLVITDQSLAVYEGAHNLIDVAVADPSFNGITATCDESRLELSVPRNTGTSVWSERCQMDIRLAITTARRSPP